MGKLFGGYRPELHYMRGPGPKWHEKHNGVAAPVTTKRQPPQSFWHIPVAAFAMIGLWRASPQSGNEAADTPSQDSAAGS